MPPTLEKQLYIYHTQPRLSIPICPASAVSLFLIGGRGAARRTATAGEGTPFFAGQGLRSRLCVRRPALFQIWDCFYMYSMIH